MKRWARLVLCTAVCSVNLHAQSRHAQDKPERAILSQTPLQVELLAAVDANKLTLGAQVLAKTRIDWNQPNCRLRAGSVVVGHVVDLQRRTKQLKGSSLAINFDHANCEGHITPVPLILFAVIGRPEVDEGIPLADTGARFGASSSNPHMGVPGGKSTALAPAPVNNKDDMSTGRQDPNDNTPGMIVAGQVIGLKKITLSVGTGTGGASVLSSVKDNVRLEGATQLILMPKEAVPVAPSPTLAAKSEAPSLTPSPAPAPTPESTPVAAQPPPPEPVAPPEVDETTICDSACSTVSNSDAPAIAHASLTLSTSSFGYIPHDKREYEAFDFESTLTYLDAHNLLFTYDPHKLRQRLPLGIRTESLRTIRAILLDSSTLHVKRILDWQIQGSGQYIWRAGPGRILVHLGHHLRLLGPDLEVLRDLPVPGLLAFVSTSPDGNHIAVSTYHERYTHAMREQLAQVLDAEPEEDVDIQLFDGDLHSLLTARQSSSLPPPVLSDAGEIRIHSAAPNHWRISETLWDRSSRNVATVISACHPNLATPMPGSVFLIGCSKSPLQNWYRMIRLDGHAILKGHGSSQEIEQSSSSSNQSDFAVRVVRAKHSKTRGDRFRKDDLHDQEVSVYRASDGKRLFTTSNPGVSLAEQSFALSPAGNQLVVLSDASISLYPIGKPSP
jgi:hypothetical protein